MRDFDIRQVLKQYLAAVHQDEAGTLIVDEVKVCDDEARADVVVVNGSLTGYEIKSDRDTLERLDRQQKAYCKVFDQVWVVSGMRHMKRITERVPLWWGLIGASEVGDSVALQTHRAAGLNPALDAYELAGMLWRAELLAALEQRGLDRGVRTKPWIVLRRRLSDSVATEEVAAIVRESLKARTTWRADLLRT